MNQIQEEEKSEDLKEKVLEDPNTCPFCGSVLISFPDYSTSPGKRVWTGICSQCRKSWEEVYILNSVSEV